MESKNITSSNIHHFIQFANEPNPMNKANYDARKARHARKFDWLRACGHWTSISYSFSLEMLNEFYLNIENNNESSIVIIHIILMDNSYELVLPAVNKMLQPIRTTNISLTLILHDDFVYTSRPYLFTNRDKRFLQLFESYQFTFQGCLQRIVTSSNAYFNRWGEGDVYKLNILDLLSDDIWKEVKNNIRFDSMTHKDGFVPRLVAIQSICNKQLGRPIYRHPTDRVPENIEMIPIVRQILEYVERATHIVGLNHALIQYYRDGYDHIAEHSDKTLDIDRQTPIVNLSLGATRYFVMKEKNNKSNVEIIELHHGDCLVFGLRSNQFWYHEVPKSVNIKAHAIFGHERISFTLRKINSFLHDNVVVGQGSPYKTIEQVSCKNCKDSFTFYSKERLIQAFSSENKQSSEFDWDITYGDGFLIH